MPSRRILRVQELLKRHLGESIRREIPLDGSSLITVSEVRVSNDLRDAKVYVSILGTPQQQKSSFTLLQHHRHRIQAQLAQDVVLKFIPQLRFTLDDSVTRGNRVLEILDELEDPAKPS